MGIAKTFKQIEKLNNNNNNNEMVILWIHCYKRIYKSI